MPLILVNFELKKETIPNTMIHYCTIKAYKHVYADMPVAAVQLDKKYDKPVALMRPGAITSIIEEEEAFRILAEDAKNNRDFKLVVNPDSTVRLATEDDKPEDILERRFPKNTDISKLIFFNNEILMMEIEETGE